MEICQVIIVNIVLFAVFHYYYVQPSPGRRMPVESQRRFLDTTRGRLISLLRRGAQTIDELRKSLGVSDNAVRSHLSSLERDGLVRQKGVRRGSGAGKPAVIYELHSDAELMLSRAYAPVLGAILDEIAASSSSEDAESLLKGAGRRLASALPRNSGETLEARVANAVAVINSLGGDAEIETAKDRLVIRGCGCPLSAVTGRRPEACKAVQALVAELVGRPVEECCGRGDRPQCRFEVSTAA